MRIARIRRSWLITASVLMTSVCMAPTASATFPGRNGPIAFRPVDFETGLGGPLTRANPDGTQATQLTDLPGFFSDWRADGRRIAFDFFDADGNEQIATVATDGGDLRVITSGPGIHEVPSWSPNGRHIVLDFSPEADPSTPGFETRLWTMRANGSKAKPLPLDQPGFDTEPRYSPNGRWIVFARLRSNGEESALFVVRAKGGEARQITDWGSFAEHAYPEHPTWSPHSRWIVFNLAPDGTIEAVRRDGTARHTIRPATETFGGHKPWFSPDGSRILLMCENQGLLSDPPPDYNEDLCVMHADGSDIVNITNTPEVFENWPSWGPAASRGDDDEGEDDDRVHDERDDDD